MNTDTELELLWLVIPELLLNSGLAGDHFDVEPWQLLGAYVWHLDYPVGLRKRAWVHRHAKYMREAHYQHLRNWLHTIFSRMDPLCPSKHDAWPLWHNWAQCFSGVPEELVLVADLVAELQRIIPARETLYLAWAELVAQAVDTPSNVLWNVAEAKRRYMEDFLDVLDEYACCQKTE